MNFMAKTSFSFLQEEKEDDPPKAEGTQVKTKSGDTETNRAHFYIAKLSQKLNSKLNQILSPENGPHLSHSYRTCNPLGLSDSSVLNNSSILNNPDFKKNDMDVLGSGTPGDELMCLVCPATLPSAQLLKEHRFVCMGMPSLDDTGPDGSRPKEGFSVHRRPFCEVCGKKFAKSWQLKRHYNVHTDRKLSHVCPVCEAKFDSVDGLVFHKALHLTAMPYVCPKCNKGFPARGALKDHARIHIKDMPFSCRFCGKRFMQRANLRFHLKVHDGMTIYPCDECEEAFDSVEERATHKAKHNVIMPFKCVVCSQAFSTVRHLEKHMNLHDLGKPHKCCYCNLSFSHEKSLQAHKRIIHSDIVICDQCEILAYSVTSDITLEEFMCTECDIPFLHAKCRQNHIKTHPKDEKFPCHLCDRVFPFVSAFHRHMLVHTGGKKFMCTDCDSAFYRRTQLRQHMQDHNEDRPFSCEACGKKFALQTSLAKHLLTDAGHKSYACKTCGESFGLACLLETHERLHTNKRKKSSDGSPELTDGSDEETENRAQ